MTQRKVRAVYITVSMPPYRSSVCVRIRKECPEVDFIAGVTHHPGEGDRWPLVPQSLVPQVLFAPSQTTYARSPAELLRDMGKAWRIVRWLARYRPDVVIVHGYDDPSRLATIAWCALSGTRLIIAGDSNIRLDRPRGIKRAIKSAYLHAIMRCASAAFPFGTLGVAYFRRYGMAPSRVFMFPAEPDYDFVAGEGGRRRAEVAARYRLAGDRRRLLYSGRLAEVKRVDLLITAFARIAADRPDWDVVILGSGPERDRLVAMVPPTLAHRVTFIPAIQDPADVYAMYHACDVLVLPSDYEPWALVVNEAAAAGQAIVCSDIVGAAADLLREGVNGRSFRTGDEADLARALLDVTDPQNLARYRSASPIVVRDWRSRADPVDGFRAALKRLGLG